MKRLAALLWLSCLFSGAAFSQTLIDCAPGVTCDPVTGPSLTGTGDPTWVAFGKVNVNLKNLFNGSQVLNLSGLTTSTETVGTLTVTGNCTGCASIVPTGTIQCNNSGSPAIPGPCTTLSINSITGGTAGTLTMNVNGYVSGEGLQNICTQPGNPCFGDTMWVNETNLTCSGSPATVGGISSNGENLLASPYVGAQAVVTGCGPAAAQNAVGGITLVAHGSGYLSSSNPIGTADYIAVAGGTTMNGSSFTGVLASGGVLTVSAITGQIYLGMVIAGSGVPNVVIVRDFISGTGGNGTYMTNYAGAGVSSEAMTGSNPTVLRVLNTSGPLATLSNAAGTGSPGGPYTGVSLVDAQGLGTGAIGTVTMNGTLVSSVTVTTAGSGYVTGYNVTFTITGGSGSAQVATVTGNAIAAAAVVGGGQYSTAPSGTISQSVSSGSGTGATFNLTYIGLPIYGTVASLGVDGHSFTFAPATSANTVHAIGGGGQSEQLVMGHSDDAAVTATLATIPVGMFFPHTQKPAWVNTPLGYGFNNPITLPNNYRFSVLCQGTRIMPLAPLNAQFTVAFQSNTSLFYRSEIDNCDTQGMGIANYNYYISAARFALQNGAAENAAIENIFIGDSAGDNAANDEVNGMRVHTDMNAVPAWPAYNYEDNQSADNVMNFANMDTAMWGGALVNGADLQIRNTHLFAYGAGPCYDVEATKAGIDGICDNMAPGQAGYFLNSSLTNLHDGWQCSNGNTFFGQYCVYVNIDQRSTIGCGTGANNAAWIGEYANLVFFNFSTTSMTTRPAPCSGNGSYDPPIFVQSVTAPSANLGTVSIADCVSGCGGSPVVVQSGMGFVVQGTCTLSATGGVSCTTAMDDTSTHYEYLYFPASQLAASGNGSAAGFYAVQWTSGTAGQVCSTAGTAATVLLYVSGTPTIPSACSTFTPNSAAAITPATATDLTAITTTLAANSIGLNGELDYDWTITTDGAAGTHTSKVKYNSVIFGNLTPTTVAQASALVRFRNRGAQNSNVSYATANTASGSTNLVAAAVTYPNISTNSAQTVAFTLQLSTLTASWVKLASYSVKLYGSSP